jgi:uncharacterized protein involved in exopolysaccharide biosynthesis
MTTPHSSGAAGTSQSEPSLVTTVRRLRQALYVLTRPLVRHGRMLSAATALAGMLTVGLSFLVRNEYTSRVSFFVDRTGSRLPSGLGSLGQQLGLRDEEAGQPLEFYAWLASSEPVLSTILLDTVPVGARKGESHDPASATSWAQLLDEPPGRDSLAQARAVDKLRTHVRANTNLETSLVTITVSAPTRSLAMWLASRIFAELNEANTVTRQTRAGNEFQFLRKRQERAADELRSAEADLTTFYQKNRRFQDSPVLVFEEERLRRAVDLAREVYITLTRSAQDAELRAVRDIPALTLIEGPIVPVRRSKPHRLLLGFLGALLGFALTYTRAWWRDLDAAEHRTG